MTYFIVWLLTTGPAARPKGKVTSAHGLLPRDYFISLHCFIISWVWVVLLAGLYSALLTTTTLNSVQTGIPWSSVHTGTDCWSHTSSPQMQLCVPKRATWGTSFLDHPVLQHGKVSWEVSGQRKESHDPFPGRCWKDAHLLPARCHLISPHHLCLRAERAFMYFPL